MMRRRNPENDEYLEAARVARVRPQDPLDEMSTEFFTHSRAAAQSLRDGALGSASWSLAAANYYLGRLEQAGQSFATEGRHLVDLCESLSMEIDKELGASRRGRTIA